MSDLEKYSESERIAATSELGRLVALEFAVRNIKQEYLARSGSPVMPEEFLLALFRAFELADVPLTVDELDGLKWDGKS